MSARIYSLDIFFYLGPRFLVKQIQIVRNFKNVFLLIFFCLEFYLETVFFVKQIKILPNLN